MYLLLNVMCALISEKELSSSSVRFMKKNDSVRFVFFSSLEPFVYFYEQ